MKPFHCEICSNPDYVECDMKKHKEFELKKRAKEISKEDPEELLP